MATITAVQDLTVLNQLRIVITPPPLVSFETATQPDTVLLEHATSSGSTFALAVAEWQPQRVVATLALTATPFPPLGPTDSYHVVLTDSVGAAGTAVTATTYRTTVPLVLTKPASTGPGSETVRVAFTVTPAALGGEVQIDATPLLGDFTFIAGSHAPFLENEQGQRAALTNVAGWGTRRLTGRLPAGFACQTGLRRILLENAGHALVAQVLPEPVFRLANEFRVVVTRFRCHHETYDDATQSDGQRDEVFFVSANASLANGGLVRPPAVTTSPVYGDTTGGAGRIRAGSSRKEGGIRTGDPHTLQAPWELWRGRLAQPADAVVIAPMIFEWDKGGSPLTVSGNPWLGSLGSVAPSVLAEVVSATSAPVLGRLTGSLPANAALRLPSALPELSKKDEPGHRPIGVRKHDGTYYFRPQVLALTFALAEALARTRVEIPLRYTEPKDWLDGDYELWLRVEACGTESALTDPLPAPSKTEVEFTRVLSAVSAKDLTVVKQPVPIVEKMVVQPAEPAADLPTRPAVTIPELPRPLKPKRRIFAPRKRER